jgi:DNA-binding NarL/FixJ family response regulator
LKENYRHTVFTSYKGKEGILYDKEMGRKIPEPIRMQVIRALLDGKSRDKIAQELGISTGAVSGIIENLRKDDPI